MSVFLLISRILFAVVFLIVPVGVIGSSSSIAEAPPLRHVPLPRISVVGASATAIGAAMLVVLGVWPDLGALLIAAYLVPVTVVIHPFWTFQDPGQANEHRETFLLNTSVLGAASSSSEP